MTVIKFCGMTRGFDVSLAVDLGVDALGFVLWPGSPRHVELDRVKPLLARLPSNVIPVGVFVTPESTDIRKAVDAGIRVAQIHGTGTIPVGINGCEVWIAASLAGDGIAPQVGSEHMVLLDAAHSQRYGGTGRTINWEQASRVAATRRVMLAGGLTPSNVGQAIRDVRPYGVDVASGIEERPGVKSAAAMRAFVAAVREAER